MRSIDGGVLVQQSDVVSLDRSAWRVVTKVAPTEEQWADLELAWIVCAAVSSNAIVLVGDQRAVGIGAGQQNRVDSARIAATRAAGRAARAARARAMRSSRSATASMSPRTPVLPLSSSQAGRSATKR